MISALCRANANPIYSGHQASDSRNGKKIAETDHPVYENICSPMNLTCRVRKAKPAPIYRMVALTASPHPFTAPETGASTCSPAAPSAKTGPADGENPPLMHQRAHIRHIAVHRKRVGFASKALHQVTFVTLGLLPHSDVTGIGTEKLDEDSSQQHNSGLLRRESSMT